ncbi:LOW QUALITY PROTEIN: hypothetical protein CRUP_030928 [Coryphaenoides rupestris]|nr:LOW QUALITY PROTEIN: hypothetical protein CRUP_030928 [Coryphaenoides rupestris]
MTELRLHEAAAAGDLELVEELLRSHRCDPNHRDVDWATEDAAPLGLGWSRRRVKQVEEEEGKQEQGEEEEGKQEQVEEEGKQEQVEEGKQEEEEGKQVEEEGKQEQVEEEGKQEEEEGSRGGSPGHAQVVRVLLESGARPGVRTDTGRTPAHCAAEAGRLGVLRLLHALRAPVDLEDVSGDRPIRMAGKCYGHADCVHFLKTYVSVCLVHGGAQRVEETQHPESPRLRGAVRRRAARVRPDARPRAALQQHPDHLRVPCSGEFTMSSEAQWSGVL